MGIPNVFCSKATSSLDTPATNNSDLATLGHGTDRSEKSFNVAFIIWIDLMVDADMKNR